MHASAQQAVRAGLMPPAGSSQHATITELEPLCCPAGGDEDELPGQPGAVDLLSGQQEHIRSAASDPCCPPPATIPISDGAGAATAGGQEADSGGWQWARPLQPAPGSGSALQHENAENVVHACMKQAGLHLQGLSVLARLGSLHLSPRTAYAPQPVPRTKCPPLHQLSRRLKRQQLLLSCRCHCQWLACQPSCLFQKCS